VQDESNNEWKWVADMEVGRNTATSFGSPYVVPAGIDIHANEEISEKFCLSLVTHKMQKKARSGILIWILLAQAVLWPVAIGGGHRTCQHIKIAHFRTS
jgi:hypothetical protein